MNRLSNDKGFYMVFTAIALVALLYVVGLAIDVGKLELDRTKLQLSADAGAVVAGSRIAKISPTGVEDLALLVARDNMDRYGLFYDTNDVGSYIQSRIYNDNTEVEVSTNTDTETFLIGKAVRGQPNWSLQAAASAHKRPVAVVLVVDKSGSMNCPADPSIPCQYTGRCLRWGWRGCIQREGWDCVSDPSHPTCSPSKLDKLKEASNVFVDSFNEDRDVFSVVAYSDDAEVTYNIAANFNKVAIKASIDSLRGNGWTNLHDGIKKSRDQLASLPDIVGEGCASYRKVIVLITDGAPNRHEGNWRNYPDGCPDSSTREALVWPILEADLARNENTLIFGIGIGAADDNLYDSFQTQPTNSNPGTYLLKSVMFRRIVNDQTGGWSDPQFPSSCFQGYAELSSHPRGEYLESPDIDDIYYMLEQVSLAIQMKLTR